MMTPDRWEQIDKLFHAALACEPGQQAEFLAAQCADDEALRSEVESLIASHQQAENFIETFAGDMAAELLNSRRSTFESGQQIENYRIVSQLGSGGMGEVYLAEDTRLHRKVALKLLPPHFTVDPDRVRRFEREARAASALNHPNIVTVHDIRQSKSAQFIAAEFVDGKTLRQLINEKPLTLGETLNVAIQVAGALSAAHTAGIVHRDIKPENIMIRTDGYVKILDFGLAKLTEVQTTDAELETPTLLQSNPGLVMGTVQYMSPEQARGKHVDARADIWSLGIVLYELLAGRVPFSGETPSHVMVALMENPLPPLTDYQNVPAELDRIVTKTLRKRPKERYQNARQLLLELKTLKRKLRFEEGLRGTLQAVPVKATRDTSAGSVDFVAPAKNFSLPILIFVILFGVIIGGVRLIRMRIGTKPNEPVATALKPELIRIPGGTFQMGRENSLPTEAPALLVRVLPFEMDKTEVTNTEYGDFVIQTNHVPPQKWSASRPPTDQEKLPVSDVSYADAVAFAEWRSKRDGVTYRLPTEEQWEYAARNGNLNNLFPWGDHWESQRAVTLESAVAREQPVGSCPLGANVWGVQDLIGNVWEWTSSLAPSPAQHEDWMVVRGGGWSSPSNKLSATSRDWFAPNYKDPRLGFRLVTSGDYTVDSLAVLPFNIYPNDPSNEKLANSVTENVVNNLSQLFPRVTPLSAVSRYKYDQTNVFDIGRELKVRGVAVGYISLGGDRAMIRPNDADKVTIEIKVFDVRDNKQLEGLLFVGRMKEIAWLETKVVQGISKKIRVSEENQK